MRSAGAAVLTVFVAFAADAVQLMRGDVIRTATAPMIMCPMPPPTAALSPDLRWKDYVYASDALAFDAVGNLYTVYDKELAVFDSALHHRLTVELPENASSVTVDAAGFAYVLGESGTVYVHSPAGVRQRTFVLPALDLPARNVSIDMASDSCTLVYLGSGSAVNRFDTCANRLLPAIAAGERFDVIRAMADGGFAGASGDRIVFYDAGGHVVYNMAAPPGAPVASLVFDVDPRYLWIATTTGLVKMRISDLAVMARENSDHPHGVAVFGEQRPAAAALPGAAPAKRRGSRH